MTTDSNGLPKSFKVLPPVANPRIPRLIDLCLDTIVKNFTPDTDISQIPRKYHRQILSKIPTDIDLITAVMAIPDGEYWKRRTLDAFPRLSYDPARKTWKRLFIENYAVQQLEQATDETLDDVLKELKIIGPFVSSLTLERTPSKVTVMQLFRNFRTLRNLRLVYGEPHRSFAKYEEFNDFTVAPENGATVKDCQLIGMDFAALGKKCSLQEFDMSDNSLDDKSAEFIAKGLYQLRSLTVLRFAYNTMKKSGAHALATVMVNNPVRILDLSHNQIGSEGTNLVAGIAKLAPMLKELNLSGNRIGNKGIIFIALMLKETKSLEKLDISANNISNFGDLIDAIHENTTLVEINLAANPIGEEYLEPLMSIHNASGTLMKADVRWYKVTEDDYAIKTSETSEAPLLRFKQKATEK